MFDLNPLNLPDATWQHALMLVVAGFLGFLIGYASRKQRIRHLLGDIASTERELADCRRAPAPVTAGSDEAVMLARIRHRARALDLDRIGRATAAEADNLKLINGVGALLERKLNAVDIYTFRQVASLAPDDVESLNDVLEIFPGRIQRENWVGQAAELVRNQAAK